MKQVAPPRPPAGHRLRARLGSLGLTAAAFVFLNAAICPPGGGVTDPEARVDRIDVFPETVTVNVGATTSIDASVMDPQNRVLLKRTLTWSSDAPAIATVEGAGDAGIITGRSVGSANVLVSTAGVTGRAHVRVVQPTTAVASVRFGLLPSGNRMARLDSMMASVIMTDTRGENVSRGFTIASSDPSILEVSTAGTVGGNFQIFAHREGQATITATSEGKTVTATLTVTPPRVARVTLTPDTVRVAVGSEVRVTPRSVDKSGAAIGGHVYRYSVVGTSTASVTQAGVVRGLAAGTTRLFVIDSTADVGGEFAIIVAPAPVARVDSVQIFPRPVPSTPVGQALQLEARVWSGGKQVTDKRVTWTQASADATLDSTGRFVASKAGSYTVSARADSVTATATVTVVASGASRAVGVRPLAVWTTKRLAAGGTETFSGVTFAGDHEANGDSTMQAFAALMIDTVPASATLDSAKLRVTLDADLAGTPFDLGTLWVELAESSTLGAGAPSAGAVVLATAATPTAVTADVTPLVRSARAAGRSSVTLRFRFTRLVNGNKVTDSIGFTVDQLTFHYTAPAALRAGTRAAKR